MRVSNGFLKAIMGVQKSKSVKEMRLSTPTIRFICVQDIYTFCQGDAKMLLAKNQNELVVAFLGVM